MQVIRLITILKGGPLCQEDVLSTGSRISRHRGMTPGTLHGSGQSQLTDFSLEVKSAALTLQRTAGLDYPGFLIN